LSEEQKGHAADRILKDPIIKEVIQEIRQDCFRAIEKSTFFQNKTREEAYKMLRTVGVFENKLKKMVESGKVAQAKKDKKPINNLRKLW